MKLHRNAKTTPTSRLELVRRTVDDGWRYQAVADGYGVSVRTVAKWVQRFRQLGAAGLEDGSSRPQQTPAHHLASPGDVHSPVAGAARLASLGDRPRVADAAVHGRGLVATLGIEPAAYRPVGAHPALRVAAPGGFVARRHQAAGPVSARRPIAFTATRASHRRVPGGNTCTSPWMITPGSPMWKCWLTSGVRPAPRFSSAPSSGLGHATSPAAA